MANKGTINEIVDPIAYKQIDDLIKAFVNARGELVGFTSDVKKLNDQISGAKSIKELEAANEKMAKSLEDAANSAEKAKKKNEELDSTYAKIAGTTDEATKKQVALRFELTALGKQQALLKKEFEAGKITQEQYLSASAMLAKNQQELKTSIAQVTAEAKKEEKAAQLVTNSYNAKSAKLVELKNTYKNLTAEEANNAKVGGVMLAQIQALDKELKATDKTMGDSQRNVGNYSGALEGIPGPIGRVIAGFNSMKAAALSFIATPLGVFLTGLSATLLAAKGLFEYNKNLQESTKLTKQFTDLSGDNLKAFRTEVQAAADVFNKDFKEVLISANAVAKQFGISQSEALDIINKGFASGADANGEFLDTLKEYPSQLKTIGLNAEETVAIISQSITSGVYSDKGIDAIKEAGIRIREMTPATKAALENIGLSGNEIQKGLENGTLEIFDVIQQVSGKLNELPESSAKVGTALADIFGGPGEDAGIKYIKSLSTIELGLDNLVEKQGDVAKAQLLQLKSTEELEKVYSSLFDATGGTFELLIANAKLFLTNFLIKIISGTVDLINYFIDLYNNAILIRGVIQSNIAVWGSFFKIVFFGIGQILSGFATLGKVIGAVLKRDLGSISGILKQSAIDSKNDVKNLGESIANGFIDGYNKTVNNKPISKIKVGLTVTDSRSATEENKVTSVFTPTSSAASKKAKEDAIRDAYELSKTRLEIERDEADRLAKDQTNAYELRLASQEIYYNRSKKLLEEQAAFELLGLEKNGDKAKAIRAKLEADLNNLKIANGEAGVDILTDTLSQEEKLILKNQQDRLSRIDAARDEELSKVVGNDEASKAKRLEIQNRYLKETIAAELEGIEAIIEANKLKSKELGIVYENEAQDVAKLAALKLKYTQVGLKDEVTATKDAEAKKAQLRKDAINTAKDIAGAFFSVQLDSIRKEGDEQQAKSDAERKQIEDSALSEEAKRIRIEKLDAKDAKRKEEYAKKERKIIADKARFERAVNIASIIINTAKAVVASLPAIPLSIAVGALGAAQLAIALAQPLPAYEKGGITGEGYALVSEKGPELRIDPDGKVSLTPENPTIDYFEKGTRIVSNDNLQKMLAQGTLANHIHSASSVDFDVQKLIESSNKNTSTLKKALMSKPTNVTQFTHKGVRHIHKSENNTTEYLNRNF